MNRSDTVFANLVVQKKLASREQVDECIEIVKKAAQTQTPTTLADTMVGKGYLSRPDADALLAQAQPGGTTKRLAGYELISELGRGGMGVVYKARQVTMERIVALKILRPSLTKDKTYIERFFHEAKSAAKLNHPNIIHVIDAGLADGYHFFAMEFVDGCTLAERLQQGRLDEPEALEIARQIALALSHAQQHGIVHRDIKPENIMLTGDGVAKLADLGVARGPEAGKEAASGGQTLGTPYYMSPEQARGEATIDARSDIYSLGAALFHILTGSLPFDGETPAIVASKRLTEPSPAAAAVRPDLHPATDELIRRMMAKDPANRPQTADELLADIDAAMHAPALDPGVHLAGRRRRPPKKSGKHWMLIGGAALLALAVGIVLIIGNLRPEPPPGDPAVRMLREALSYYDQYPNDLDGSIERLTRIVRDYKDTDSAEQALPLLAKLSSRKKRSELDAQLTGLKKSCDNLAQQDKYGDAIALIDAFVQDHEDKLAKSKATKLRNDVQTAARQRFTDLERQAAAALEKKDFAEARAAIETVARFGLEEYAKQAQDKLVEIDAFQENASLLIEWKRISTQVNKLLEARSYEAAAQALAQAENFPAEQFGKQRDELAREIEKRIRNREAARASAIREYAAAFAKQVRPPIEQRTYRQAAAALDTLAKQPKLRPAAQRIERDSKDIARLAAFWQEVEKQAAGLEAGVAITIDGKRVVFDEYKDGKIFYKHSAVRRGDALVELGAPDIVGLFGSEFPENETQILQAAAFLLFDKKPDRAAARRILLKAKPGDDAERYMALALAPGELEADEKAGREALGTLEKTIAAGSTRMKAALARFLEDFGHTRFYNDHLATIEKLRSGEKDEPAEKPPLPDLASETKNALRAHWGMDGIRDKRVRDKTGRGNDARPHDNVRFEEGIMGGCADLERGYLEIPYNMALVTKGSFSIDFCMKAKSLFKYSAGPPVISLGADKSGSIRKGAGGAFSLRVRNDGLALDFRPVAAGNDRDDTPAVHPIAGRKWYHVALVVDSAKREATMYVGGKQARRIKMSAGFNNTQRHPLVIGGESAKRYQGFIDEVHLWLCPLSAEQVMTLAEHWGLGPEGEQAEIREKRKARIDMHNARLGKTTSWKNIGLPLQHAIASLLSRIEVPYQWDRSAKEIGDLAHKRIKANFTDVPAGEALRRALAPLKLVYQVDEEGVFLRPQ